MPQNGKLRILARFFQAAQALSAIDRCAPQTKKPHSGECGFSFSGPAGEGSRLEGLAVLLQRDFDVDAGRQ
ncbi:hypothetical protein, partial [Achromobacter pulmonis]|uniref:hypothetical protein n=1 Tax=Achromobacter pulmonis TaxID=1389932 RepID=UPI001C62E1DC